MTATTPEPVRRKLRTPALILLGLAGIDVGVRLTANTWERHSPDDYAERVNGCAAGPRGVVVVGGSPVSEGIRPGVLAGVHWRGDRLADGYALGLPGATTTEVYHAVLRGCPTPPKLLVYGITASDLNDARDEPHGPCSLMTWGDLREWATTRPETAGWAARQFLLGKLGRAWAAYHHRHGVRMWAALRADALFPGCCPDAVREAKEMTGYADALRAGRGYAPAAGFVTGRYDHAKRDGRPTPPFAFLDKYRTGSHLKYLHKLLDHVERQGTAVVLVDMPVTADLEAKYPAAFAEYRARLAELEADRGVTVLRAHRAAVGLNDAHFADLIHLNADGSMRLSRWLRDRLSDAGSDPDGGLIAKHGRSEGVGP